MSLIEALCAKLMFETHVWLLNCCLRWIRCSCMWEQWSNLMKAWPPP